MKRIFLLTLLLAAFLCACSPSEKSLQLTATQVASEIFGTQTATAPTSTITFTPSPTLTPGPTSTITPPPTLTKEPTATQPPTATLDADGVERMILCYKAGVIVHADMEAFVTIANRRSDVGRTLSNFQKERQSRMNSIFIRELPSKYDAEKMRPEFVEALKEYVLVVNNIRLTDADCAGEYSTIANTNLEIEFASKNYTGFTLTRMRGQDTYIKLADTHLREALETVYGVDPAKLDSIADPIWQHVHSLYGVEIP